MAAPKNNFHDFLVKPCVEHNHKLAVNSTIFKILDSKQTFDDF